MSVQIPPGYGMATVEHWLSSYNRPAVTTWGVDLDGVVGNPDGVANAFFAAYESSLKAGIDNSVTLRDCRMYIGQDAADPIIGYATGTAVGGRSGESTPPSLALMVEKRSEVGGRRNRGRAYIPWALADTAVTEIGAIIPATLTSWQTLFDNFHAALTSDSFTPVILHGPGVSTPGAPTPITRFVVNPTVRTQRRRQVRY